MATQHDLRLEADGVAAEFAQHLFDAWLHQQTGAALFLGGEKFTVEYPEVFAPLFGWDEDDDMLPTVLRRESDGAYFQVDVEVGAMRISPKGEASA